MFRRGVSPDGKKWAFANADEICRVGYHDKSLNVIKVPSSDNKDCLFQRSELKVAWIEEVYDIVFHPDFDRVFFYLSVNLNVRRRKVVEDWLIAYSTSQEKVLWSVTVYRWPFKLISWCRRKKSSASARRVACSFLMWKRENGSVNKR